MEAPLLEVLRTNLTSFRDGLALLGLPVQKTGLDDLLWSLPALHFNDSMISAKQGAIRIQKPCSDLTCKHSLAPAK